MAKRTDIHRPSAINPAEYSFVATDYYGPSYMGITPAAVLGERAVFRAHMAKTGGKYAGHDHGGTCHVCGAAALYVAKFHHARTNSYITTGMDCADKLEMGDARAFKTMRRVVKDWRDADKGKRKAMGLLTEAGMAAAWELYTGERPTPCPYEEGVIIDMVSRLVRYGSISDKAIGYMRALLVKIAERPAREAAKAAEKAAAKPVPVVDGRRQIVGKVLSIKGSETRFGYVTKMLVQADDGWKVWGTKPSGLECDRGDRVTFVAAIEPSKDDPKFGFFSRPANAAVLGGGVVAV